MLLLGDCFIINATMIYYYLFSIILFSLGLIWSILDYRSLKSKYKDKDLASIVNRLLFFELSTNLCCILFFVNKISNLG